MQDLTLGALIFFPKFIWVIFLGFFTWLLVRLIYRKHIFNGAFWHPNLIDLGVLFLCIYISHTLMISLESSL
ncbi:DUF1656 domain-containing protein [Acerihabitans sp. KWT182]|uniref:DUF1656 domain-containing protein n=1 Tax=Acerihabitans sp. KWT182 TaxID=3157919 RepID=A0AAU7Q5Q2_9GAMM